jgi:hypothetical protein
MKHPRGIRSAHLCPESGSPAMREGVSSLQHSDHDNKRTKQR